jgi:hypothetical protein
VSSRKNNVTFGSKDNELNYCEIKNAIIGVQADTVFNNNPNVIISNSKILNMNAYGIFGQGTSIKAWNTVVSNCGITALKLSIGGSYEFYHCTVYNTWGYSNRQTATLSINNYYFDINGNIQVRPITKAFFGNCIIYGNKENEIEFDSVPAPGIFNYKFQNSIVKIDPAVPTSNPIHWINAFKNENPELKNPDINDYSLDTLSYSKDKGDLIILYDPLFLWDINNINRTSYGPPDLGAYERED